LLTLNGNGITVEKLDTFGLKWIAPDHSDSKIKDFVTRRMHKEYTL